MTIIFLFQTKIHVVVNFFLSQVIFVFLSLLGMVMYDNDVETKEKYKLPEIKKNNYNIHMLEEGRLQRC